MKTKITLITLIFFLFIGSYSFAQTVSGTASSTGCKSSGIITASSTGLGANPEYQLLLSGAVVYPIPGDATQFSPTSSFTGLASGTYTVKARANSVSTIYTSAAIVVSDGYVNMNGSAPTKVLSCTGGTTTLTTTVNIWHI